MGECVICGAQVDKLFLAKIEGAEVEVCRNCAKLGTIIRRTDTSDSGRYSESEENSRFSSSPTVINVLVENYGKLVKNARESKNWKQEDLAKKLAIKESLLHNIESGHFEPSEEMVRKLEKFLHITLMTQMEEGKTPLRKFEDEDNSPMTLGDMLKNKLKK